MVGFTMRAIVSGARFATVMTSPPLTTLEITAGPATPATGTAPESMDCTINDDEPMNTRSTSSSYLRKSPASLAIIQGRLL